MCSLRELVFYETKTHFVNQILDQTATSRDPPTVRIDRVNDKTPVFAQIFGQLKDVAPAVLRQKVSKYLERAGKKFCVCVCVVGVCLCFS